MSFRWQKHYNGPNFINQMTSYIVWKHIRQRLTNLKLQEAFKNVQKQRSTVPISVKIVTIFPTKVFQLSFPRIFLLQRKRRTNIQWFTCKLQRNKTNKKINLKITWLPNYILADKLLVCGLVAPSLNTRILVQLIVFLHLEIQGAHYKGDQERQM